MLNRLFINMRSITLASSAEETSLLKELWDYIINKVLTPEYKSYENIQIDPEAFISPPMIFFAIFIALMVFVSVSIFTRRVLGRLVRRLIRNGATSPDTAKTFSELGLENSVAIMLFINRYNLSKAVRCSEEDDYYGIKYVPEQKEDYYPEKKVADEAADDRADGTESADNTETIDNTEAIDNTETADRADGTESTDATKGESRKLDTFSVAQSTPLSKRYKRDPSKDHFYIREEDRYRLSIRYDSKGSNPMLLLVTAVGYVVLGILFIKLLPSLLTFVDAAISAYKNI